MDINNPSFLLVKDNFLEHLSHFSFGNSDKYVHTWEASGKGVFSVSSCYALFAAESPASVQVLDVVANALCLLLSVQALPKLLLFDWRVLLNRISTKDQLIICNIPLVSVDPCCVLYLTHAEASSHIFNYYTFSDYIWLEHGCG